MIERGMVLCAGRGKRLRPLTDRLPKPLIEVAGRTLLDRALDRLETHAVERAVVNVSYKGEMIERHLAARTAPHITISHETTALDSGGGVKRALPYLGEGPFFVLNGDAICLDGAVPALRRLTDAWKEDVDALLLLQPREKASGYTGSGDFFLDPEGRIKRRGKTAAAPMVFTGVQILHPRVFEHSPDGAFSLNRIYDRAIGAGRLFGFVHDGAWLHVGDPGGLAAAEKYFS